MYDPALGRWHVVDPAIENNHYEHSPYTYVYNNPIKLIDPFGLDSAQRQAAIDKSNKDVNAKQGDNPEEWNSSDCSTTLECWMNAGGESYKSAPWVDGSGAATIKENVEEESESNEVVGEIEDENDVIPGAGYVWKKKNGSYHAALVVGVDRDDNDNVTSITVNHSEYGRGFIQESFNPNDQSSRWVKREHSYFKWDSKPDVVKAKIKSVTVKGSGSEYLTPLPAIITP